ncbi:MAG: hypothetical protein J0M29_02195 [Chitinophagales bacterium]|nr:hypothetical protein [Chitinophagales bacterium]
MRYFLFSLTLSIVLLATSCQRESSADVNQDRIFTHYELFYNANEDITYARAWFRFGSITGTLLELADPSVVSFEGDKLSFNKVLAFYEKQYAGFKSSGTFKWEDTDGKVFENTVVINEIAFGAIPDSIARNAAFTIPWTGAALGDNEAAGVWINGENEGDAQAAITIENGATALIVPADKMAKVGAGPGKIYLERRSAPALLEVTGAGGYGAGVYRPKFKDVVFK